MAQIKIGIFADCQYCDCETAGNRYYRNSLKKLNDCFSNFNQTKDLKFVVGLGDLIDRDFANFEKVNSILNESKKEIFHVTGNHDLSVEKENIDKVPEQLKLRKTYYSFRKKGWQFIFLDGNEITLQSTNPEIVAEAEKVIEQLTNANKPNNKIWNGGMSNTQIKWMEKELQKAEKKNYNIVIFCHYPLYPLGVHSLWNSEQVSTIIDNYSGVKAWINGHNHAGNYILKNGVHYITMHGMVDTEIENAFSVVSFSENNIEIRGFGREISRNLPIQ